MVDVDGVLLMHPEVNGWTTNLERDLGIPAAALQRVFFAPHWDDVVHGRAELRERLALALAELSSSVSLDRLVDYWFCNDAHINHVLLDELRVIRRGGIEVHLATVQEHERAHHIWNRLIFVTSSTLSTIRLRWVARNRRRASIGRWRQGRG